MEVSLAHKSLERNLFLMLLGQGEHLYREGESRTILSSRTLLYDCDIQPSPSATARRHQYFDKQTIC